MELCLRHHRPPPRIARLGPSPQATPCRIHHRRAVHTSSSRALNLFAMLTRPTAALQLRSSTRRLPKHICLQDWRRQALHNRFKLVTGTRLGIHRPERPRLVWHSRVPSPLRLLANFAPHGACGHPWKILLAAGSGQETEEMHLPTHVLPHSYFASTAAL